MDELLTEILLGAPNLIVALVVIVWMSRKLDRVLDVLLTILIEQVDRTEQIPFESEDPEEKG